ncbi:DUF2247 domain-containing protein [Hathewaya histolytica]|uniref:Uncharacterized protein conserved in bacteria n=1 Tax=Hathewaya histolytica TaxID=1498 RepID=A0A4U9R1D5_HATHI|nr:DUF2247 family protein [Hathewaya histolytica]VTQ84308.1 Uncharacterized protein conserved in bacteria [Hathewaya histolytica]
MQFLRNEVIKIYTIDLFKNCNLKMTWSDVHWGIKEFLLDIESVSKFAEEYLTNDSQTCIDEIYELAWRTKDRELTLSLLNSVLKKLPEQNTQDNETTIRRWRYCIIKTLREHESNNSNLLDKMEIVYPDFNYPVEMRGFIKYMPPDDDYNPCKYGVEENEQHMIDKIDDFIKIEWNKINL